MISYPTTQATLDEQQLNNLQRLDEIAAQQHLEQLLATRLEPAGDFSVVSMCCGSGRTPTSQHWPIKEVKNSKNELSTFRYKDTIVTFDNKTNQLELVTYGPGKGKDARSPIDAALGINPSIEEIMTQQKELYQMISAIRRPMSQANSDIKVLPEATLIGFSRGAAAVQKMSGVLVKSLPVELSDDLEADEGFSLGGDRIVVTKEEDYLSYTVYEGGTQKKGTITKEDWSGSWNFDEFENHDSLEQEINRTLWRKGDPDVGVYALVDTEKTTWISLDAVAGRKDNDELNDHYFNNPYCKGLYIMSTRLASDHALAGFGATFPEGEGMIKIPINGKHGAVFDNEGLREIIIKSINDKLPRKDKIETIKNAVSQQNSALLMQSLLTSTSFYSQEDFEKKVVENPTQIIQSLDSKLKEKDSFIIQVGQYLGLGVGEARRNARHEAFSEQAGKIKGFLQEQNELRKRDQLPSLEGYARGCSTIDELMNKLTVYIEGREHAANSLTADKASIASGLFITLAALRAQITLDSNLSDIQSCVAQASDAVECAKKEHNKLLKSNQSSFCRIFSPGEGKLGELLNQLNDTLESNKKSLTASQEALRSGDAKEHFSNQLMMKEQLQSLKKNITLQEEPSLSQESSLSLGR